MNIAIIPARGGSKRIPRKNIKDFLGKPIIAYSIEAALESGVFDIVMVSTDDAEIAEISKKCGAEVPFFRSAETSTDLAGTVPVLIEVLDKYAEIGENFLNGCCIYPCAPFVTSDRLKEGMKLLDSLKADSLFPIVKYSYPPQRSLVIRNGKAVMLHPENINARSQDLEPIYHDAGQFYCFKVGALLAEGKLWGNNAMPLVLPESEVQDIDTLDDWILAEIKYRVLNGV